MVKDMSGASEHQILWEMPLARAFQYQIAWLSMRGFKCISKMRENENGVELFDSILNT